MSIRPARPGEHALLQALVESAYGHYIERIGQRPRPMDDDYAARIRDGQAFVTERGNEIVGLVVIEEGDDHVHIDNVAVDPRQQRRGIGRELIAFAEQRARRRGAAEVNLYTNAKMTENRALYPRLGYVQHDRREDEGFDRVFFSKRIAPE